MNKSTVLDVLKNLPEEFKIDNFLEILIIRNKVDPGLKDVQKGRMIDHDRVKKIAAKWHR